ncbi:hypothetical protein RO3G_06891 [Rhizopus delemar RA 99-880]|uniref:Uncharacterized protein n=1 Tax=Rhizopus delemar (strain RA 99-880 / ATCC MYA-4621 / FGSC 9543 / NRRL 43880) TaxID=246409 RepID=I1C156_RHIO9|nr:hypothetical protein RO3G_06891 [Rhizopus delemar RA 99-880]|eukprot:EIE82186.1 hypothetical protein RO3G_06891 [Rhizopus delemar RA 99-880]
MSEHLKNESGEEYDEAFDAKKNRLKLERSKQLKLLETTKLEEEFNNAKLSTALIDWFWVVSLLVLKKNEITYTANAFLMILSWSAVNIWISCTT